MRGSRAAPRAPRPGAEVEHDRHAAVVGLDRHARRGAAVAAHCRVGAGARSPDAVERDPRHDSPSRLDPGRLVATRWALQRTRILERLTAAATSRPGRGSRALGDEDSGRSARPARGRPRSRRRQRGCPGGMGPPQAARSSRPLAWRSDPSNRPWRGRLPAGSSAVAVADESPAVAWRASQAHWRASPSGQLLHDGPRARQSVAPRSIRARLQLRDCPAGTSESASLCASPGPSRLPATALERTRAMFVSTGPTSIPKPNARTARARSGPDPRQGDQRVQVRWNPPAVPLGDDRGGGVEADGAPVVAEP